MPRPLSRRRAILRAKGGDGGDVTVGEFVRPVWGGRLGLLESISKGWGTVLIVNSEHCHREIIEVRFLKAASADPAFGPDVRGGE